MRKLRNILNHVLDVLAGVSFLAMVALTCWQVFTRYILKNPSSWSEELVSYLFAWMSLFGSSIVVGERGHMNIPILVEKMGMGARKFFAILAEVVACLLGGAVGVFYVVLPVSGVQNIVYTILNMVEIANGTIRLDEKGEEA